MLFLITRTHLTPADQLLLEAACSQPESTSVVCSGDGVHTLMLHSTFFETLLSVTSASVKLYALSDDVACRGAILPVGITPISNQEFAALSAAHQQWVTL
ncbi:DsrH/TusB family sulfur metabolism protein [Alteromonas gracilis]|uniref:DsrH/TusB family sulfur metabolism protein n=1 Tax=Alteromonas gracilis TaxID=1479524 RepID=UPI0030CD43CC